METGYHCSYGCYILLVYNVVIIHVPLVQPDRSLHLNDSVSRKQAVFHAPWWRQIRLHLHRLYCEVFLPTLGLQHLCSSPGQRVCLSSTSWELLQHWRKLHQMVYSLAQSEVDHLMRWPIQISAKWLYQVSVNAIITNTGKPSTAYKQLGTCNRYRCI